MRGEEANAYFETWEHSLEPATERNQYDSVDSLYETRIRQMFLMEDMEGAQAVNGYMKKIYEKKEAEPLAYRAEHREGCIPASGERSIFLILSRESGFPLPSLKKIHRRRSWTL